MAYSDFLKSGIQSYSTPKPRAANYVAPDRGTGGGMTRLGTEATPAITSNQVTGADLSAGMRTQGDMRSIAPEFGGPATNNIAPSLGNTTPLTNAPPTHPASALAPQPENKALADLLKTLPPYLVEQLKAVGISI